MRLHALAPTGTRIEETEVLFANIDDEIRHMIPAHEIDTIIDNIGIPFGGFNLAFGDISTLGTGDGDILISLKPDDHGPTADYTDQLRKRLHQKFPEATFFFEPANITNQILNFGLPAPIDVQVVGRDPRQLPDRADAGASASRTFPARPTCTFTRWWIIRNSGSTWIAARPARWACSSATCPTAC